MGNKDMGESYMIQDKFIKNLLFLGVGVAKQFRVSMRCPKSRFPIQIIVFDELELIIFVSQGLTLSTASLVIISTRRISFKINAITIAVLINLVESKIMVVSW